MSLQREAYDSLFEREIVGCAIKAVPHRLDMGMVLGFISVWATRLVFWDGVSGLICCTEYKSYSNSYSLKLTPAPVHNLEIVMTQAYY